MTAVGFEPTPFRTGARNQRLGTLGLPAHERGERNQPLDDSSGRSGSGLLLSMTHENSYHPPRSPPFVNSLAHGFNIGLKQHLQRNQAVFKEYVRKDLNMM